MSSYILDASIVVQVLVEDNQTAYVRNLFASLQEADNLFVPDFCLAECGNVIWQRVMRFGLPQPTADILPNDLIELPLNVVVSAEYIPHALQIGIKHKLAIYDSVYLSLAEKLGHPLITVEAKQSTAALNMGITLKSITDFMPPQI